MRNLILVLGKRGQLGAELLQQVKKMGIQCVGVDHEKLEITDHGAVERFLRKTKPTVVINTTAYHVIPECEKYPQKAFEVNAIAVENLAKVCRSLKSAFITISTDYVFDGQKKKPYIESDPVQPLQWYGISKAAGEYAARSAYPEGTYIVRTNGVYGGKTGSKSKRGNFVLNMLKEFNTVEKLEVRTDLTVNPTYAKDLAVGILQLIRKRAPAGIYHLACEGECSWYEFARHIATLVGTKTLVSGVDRSLVDELPHKPKYSVLKNVAAKKLGIVLPTWKESVRSYIQEELRKGARV